MPLPNQLVPWRTWKEAHPNTLALKVDRARYGRETFRPQYVIGVTLGESATAFPYKLAAQAQIINVEEGEDEPVSLWTITLKCPVSAGGQDDDYELVLN